MSSKPFASGSRLVFYGRDSGGASQETSISQQQHAVGLWCRENGYILTRVFADYARSGTSLVGRDEFLKMVEYLDGKVEEKGVILWEFSRLSRDFDASMYFLADIRRRGYAVYSITENVPEGLEGRLLEAVTAYRNASFSRDLSRNVKRGMVYVFREHKAVLGNTPKGYRLAAVEIGRHRDGSAHTIHNLVPDEDTAPLVRRAFEMRAQGATIKEIHAVIPLYPTYSSYYRLFRNETYIGIHRFGDSTVADFCEPLIDLPTWEVVQAIGKARATRQGVDHPRRVRSIYVLTGLLHCGECGKPMNGRRQMHRGSPDILYYSCLSHMDPDRQCKAKVIPKTLIENRVLQVIQDDILVPPVLQLAYDRAREMAAAGDSTRQAHLVSTQRALSTTAKSIDSIVAAIKEMGHSVSLLAELADLEKRQRELQEEIGRIEARTPRELPILDYVQLSIIIRDKLQTAQMPELSVVIRGFIVRIDAVKYGRKSPLTGTIYYRLPGTEEGETFNVSL